MVRKLAHIILASGYLLCVSGFTLHLHHCGSSLTEIGFFTGDKSDDTCGCEESGNTDCCSDQEIQAASNVISTAPKTLKAPHQYLFEAPLQNTVSFGLQGVNQDTNLSGLYNTHPPGGTPDIYSLRVLRI